MIAPITGAIKINPTVLKTGSAQFTDVVPACAIAAPAKPPINVWDEEDGMPNHQVKRFQVMAESNPAHTTVKVIYSCFTVFAMVLATP